MWIAFVWNRVQWRTLVNTPLSFRLRRKAIIFLASWVTSSFSSTLFREVTCGSLWLCAARHFPSRKTDNKAVMNCSVEHVTNITVTLTGHWSPAQVSLTSISFEHTKTGHKWLLCVYEEGENEDFRFPKARYCIIKHCSLWYWQRKSQSNQKITAANGPGRDCTTDN